MKLENIYPSRYVRAGDLNGKDVTLTIIKAEMVEMGHGSEKETKLVLSFAKASKSLVCNRTIAMAIGKLHGDDTDLWINKRIVIFPTRIRAFGAQHEVIRVREQIPPAPTPAQAAAVEDASELDDENDVIDSEEDEPTRVIDAATGEIVDAGEDFDALWNKPGAPAAKRTTHDVVSNAQLMRIVILGADAFGSTWDDNIVRLCQLVSGGARTVLGDLYPLEGDKMIKGLEKKIRDEGLYADRAKLASDDAAATRIDPLPKQPAMANGAA